MTPATLIAVESSKVRDGAHPELRWPCSSRFREQLKTPDPPVNCWSACQLDDCGRFGDRRAKRLLMASCRWGPSSSER